MTTTTEDDAHKIQGLGSKSIKEVSVLMRRAAKAFRLSVDAKQVFIEVCPGVTAAFVPTIRERSTLGLLYVSFPQFACAKILHAGFYKLDQTAVEGAPKVEYRDSEGRCVLVKPLAWTTTPHHAGTGLSFRAVNAVIIQWWKGTPTSGTAHGEIVIGTPT
jgi:hypothetical protein